MKFPEPFFQTFFLFHKSSGWQKLCEREFREYKRFNSGSTCLVNTIVFNLAYNICICLLDLNLNMDMDIEDTLKAGMDIDDLTALLRGERLQNIIQVRLLIVLIPIHHLFINRK